MTTKTRNIIGWVLTILLAALFLFSAFGKFTLSGDMLKQAETMGFSAGSIKLLAVVEIVCIFLFVIPRTGVFGTLLLMAYCGGIIATHVERNMPLPIPLVIATVVFITAIIRFPELTYRITGKLPAATNP